MAPIRRSVHGTIGHASLVVTVIAHVAIAVVVDIAAAMLHSPVWLRIVLGLACLAIRHPHVRHR